MERKHRLPPIVVLSLLAVAVTACAAAETPAPPNVVLDIKDCGGTANIEIPKDKLLELAVPGMNATVKLNNDGTVTVGIVTIKSGSSAAIGGDLSKNHMDVNFLGDPDGNGMPNLNVTSVCPAPPPPTLAPTSFKGTGKYAAMGGYMPYSSNPVRGNVYSRRG